MSLSDIIEIVITIIFFSVLAYFLGLRHLFNIFLFVFLFFCALHIFFYIEESEKSRGNYAYEDFSDIDFLNKRPHSPPAFISAIMLLIALFNHPYYYYITLRWTVFVSSIFLIFIFFKWKKFFLSFVFLFITVLFNPFIPVIANRELWMFIDILCAFLFIITAFFVKKPSASIAKKRDSKKANFIKISLAVIVPIAIIIILYVLIDFFCRPKGLGTLFWAGPGSTWQFWVFSIVIIFFLNIGCSKTKITRKVKQW